MKNYEGANIRNVALIGHSHSGKTSLASAMLFTAGATQRLGRVDEGNTVTDYDDEEISRSMSITAATAVVEWGKTKINLVDTPGFNMFIHEAEMVLPAVDSALVVVDAVSGVEVVTERIWHYADKFLLPRAIICTRMDRERADFTRVMESLTTAFGRTVVPIQLPVGSEKSFTGVVDLVKMHAYTYEMGGNGKAKIGPIPANMEEEAKAAHERLVELVAEGDDALMQEFFDEGTLPANDLKKGLREAVLAKRIFPVLLSSALHNIGSGAILNFLVEIFPSPAARGKAIAHKSPDHKGETIERKIAESDPVSLFTFKTVADPFAGRITYFKVMSGVLKNEATLNNFNRGSQERLQHVQLMQGKTATAVNDLHAGDIGAVAKLKETTTGETLGDKGGPIFYQPARIPEPSITFAIEPKTRADEDRIGQAIHKILEEDLALRFARDPQTKEFLLSGAGQQHIEVVVAKLRKRYHVELTLKPPKVPYRETIRGKADVEGKHKKQSGGHGQYGVCRIKMEPGERGSGIEFIDDVFGGAIPKNWIPSVERGIREAAARGFLAGFPVVDFRVSLYDGKYHDVDSSDMAFRIAGSLAFKEAMKVAKPALLEPIMHVEVYAPDQYSGDLMGDISARRGRIAGSEARAHNVVIKAQVPFAEMLTYANDLISKTQGRATYTMEFSHYDYVPKEVEDKVVAAHKAAHTEQLVEEEV